jgi:hypothetical protein
MWPTLACTKETHRLIVFLGETFEFFQVSFLDTDTRQFLARAAIVSTVVHVSSTRDALPPAPIVGGLPAIFL